MFASPCPASSECHLNNKQDCESVWTFLHQCPRGTSIWSNWRLSDQGPGHVPVLTGLRSGGQQGDSLTMKCCRPIRALIKKLEADARTRRKVCKIVNKSAGMCPRQSMIRGGASAKISIWFGSRPKNHFSWVRKREGGGGA